MARRSLRGALVGVSISVLVGAAPGVAAGAATFDWRRDASYFLAINGSGIDWVVEFPRPLPHHVGLGQVTLIHDRKQREGLCAARGAGYLLPDEVQEGLISSKGGYDQDPERDLPDTTIRPPVIRYNPSESRSVFPDDSFVGQQNRPGVRPPVGKDGPVTEVPSAGSSPVRWQSECASDVAGSATGRDVNQLGVRVAGGMAQASVDKATGRYQGLSRGWVGDLRTIAATVGSITSQMQVTARPGAEPLISYRISVNDAKGLGPKHRFDDHDVELVGIDVPASGLVDQFNEQVRANAPAVAALGPLGLALLAPQWSTADWIGAQFAIAAPVVQANLGLAARKGTLGQNQVVLIGATRFQGVYDGVRFRTPLPAAG